MDGNMELPGPEVVGIDHIVLRTKCLPELLEFYRDKLGLKLERHLKKFGLYQLRAGFALLDILDAALDGLAELERRGTTAITYGSTSPQPRVLGQPRAEPFDGAWGLFPTHAKPLHSARTLAAQHQLAHAHSPPRQRPGSAPRARSPARPAPSRPASAVPRASLAPGRPRRRKAPSRPQWDDSTLISKGFEHIVRETKLGGLGFQGGAPGNGSGQPQPGYGVRAAPDSRGCHTRTRPVSTPAPSREKTIRRRRRAEWSVYRAAPRARAPIPRMTYTESR